MSKQKLKTFFSLLIHPRQMVVWLATAGALNFLPDTLYIKAMYWGSVGKRLHLNHPVMFSEKLQWLKLHDRQDRYITLVDKIAVKEYVASKIGKEHIIPTLGVWDSSDQIDFDRLPDRFVLKCNHDSGSAVICKDKSSLDFSAVQKKLEKNLQTDLFCWGREWPYRFVKRKILAEEYLENGEYSDLTDYKFFCFDGKPEYCQVITDRTTDERIDFYDMEWIHQPFNGLFGLTFHVQNSSRVIPCPKCFEKMKESARVLSQDIPFCRVDFYEVQGKLYFGEITLYPAAGFGWFIPDKWNLILGEKIHLQKKREDTGRGTQS